MSSPCNSRLDDAVLDAARESILAVGWRRSTISDVARRAGVSRMTIYRRWPEMRALVADLMTREWGRLVEATPTGAATTRDRIAATVCATVAALREDELFTTVLRVDPELVLPYLVQRRGRTQEAMLAGLEAAVTAGQQDGSVRPGDPVLLSRALLLAAYGFALSAPTMTAPTMTARTTTARTTTARTMTAPGQSREEPGAPTCEELDGQLQRLVEGYLAP
jgi:AcrR family transcriptional regulator